MAPVLVGLFRWPVPSRRGASAVEYTLMAAGMAVLTLAGWTTFGGDLSGALGAVGAGLTGLAGAL